MNIRIHNMTDNQILIMGVVPGTNIKELKLNIDDKLGVHNQYYQLLQNGRILPDNFLLNRYNIKPGLAILLYYLFR